MAKKSVGRNEPCPCGSGKKYKKCCQDIMDLDISSIDPFSRHNEIVTSMKMKLDNYYQGEIKKYRREAQVFFMSHAVEDLLPRDQETIFSDYLWFDFHPSPTLTTWGMKYLDTHGEFLNPHLRKGLEVLSASYLSVYQLTGVETGRILLRDLFLHKDYTATTPEALELETGQEDILILGRLLPFDDINIFSGMVLALSSKAGETEFIRQHVRYLHHLYPDLDIHSLLKDKGPVLYGIFNHAQKKQLLNLHDYRVTALTPGASDAIAKTICRSGSGYDLVHDLAGKLWFKPQGENRGYVRLVLAPDHVLSCADVLEDVLWLEQQVQEWLPENDGAIAINSQLLDSPPDQQWLEEWFTLSKDREFEKWFITPHRELKGLPPQEMLQQEDGVLEIQRLLEQVEKDTSNDEVKEFVHYIKQRIEYAAGS